MIDRLRDDAASVDGAATPVIHPHAVYTLETARAALDLAENTLPRESAWALTVRETSRQNPDTR